MYLTLKKSCRFHNQLLAMFYIFFTKKKKKTFNLGKLKLLFRPLHVTFALRVSTNTIGRFNFVVLTETK